MPVARIGKRGTMVLPASIRRKANIVEGDEILIEMDERGTLHMMKKPKDFAAALRDIHQPDVDQHKAHEHGAVGEHYRTGSPFSPCLPSLSSPRVLAFTQERSEVAYALLLGGILEPPAARGNAAAAIHPGWPGGPIPLADLIGRANILVPSLVMPLKYFMGIKQNRAMDT